MGPCDVLQSAEGRMGRIARPRPDNIDRYYGTFTMR